MRRLLCKLGLHWRKRGAEWRTSKATLWGKPWPWGMSWLHYYRRCMWCGKQWDAPTPSKKVEDAWGLQK